MGGLFRFLLWVLSVAFSVCLFFVKATLFMVFLAFQLSSLMFYYILRE